MLAEGTDLYVVSEGLGHLSVAITKDVYGQLVEGQKRAAATRMSEPLLAPTGSRNGSQANLPQTRTLAERERRGIDKGKHWRARR